MKVINILQNKQKSKNFSSNENLDYLKNFRAISALEGLSTTAKHSEMLSDLACGKISKQDYIKARMKTVL